MPDTSERPSRGVIYIRVSRIGKRDVDSASYQTEAQQEDKCRHLAAMKGIEVVDVVRDIDVSGASWDRKGLNEVLAMAERKEIEWVLLFKLSRLGRGLRGVLDTVETLQGHGCLPLTTDDGIDLSTSIGRLMFRVLASFDEYEREIRTEGWVEARRRAHERGVQVGPTPYGFVRNAEGFLEPHPREAEFVREMFRRRLDGAPLSQLADYLDEVDPRDEDGSWSINHISRVLYRGHAIGRVTLSGSVKENAHEPLVSLETWTQVQTQRIMPVRRTDYIRHPFYLKGIARCESCGRGLNGQSTAGENRSTPLYSCGNRRKCAAPAAVTAKVLEGYVTPLVMAQVRRRQAEKMPAQVEPPDARFEEAEREVVRWVEDTEVREILGDAAWRAGLRARVEARDAAREEVSRALIAAETEEVTAEDVEEDPQLLRAATQGLLAKVIVRRGRMPAEEKVLVHWR